MSPFGPGSPTIPLGPGSPSRPSRPSLPLRISRFFSLGETVVLLFTTPCLVMSLLKVSFVTSLPLPYNKYLN